MYITLTKKGRLLAVPSPTCHKLIMPSPSVTPNCKKKEKQSIVEDIILYMTNIMIIKNIKIKITVTIPYKLKNIYINFALLWIYLNYNNN